MKMVREKHNFTGITGIFKVISGGNTNEFVICRGFDKFGEMGEFQGTDKILKTYTMKCLDGMHIEKTLEFITMLLRCMQND